MSKLLKLLANRYGEQKVDGLRNTPAAEALNPVLETILAHCSVRAFRPDALPAGTVELLTAAAQSAPSSSNLQTWSVIAVEDEGRRQRLSALVGNQAQVREAPLVLAWLADLSRLRGIADDRDEQAEGLRYLDTFLMAVIDAALAAQNVVTAAESLGLGTVYIGALRNQPEAVARELNTGAGVFPVFGLCIGVPDLAKSAAVKPRLSQRSVLYREQYAPTQTREVVAAYDEIMKAFYGSQQLPPRAWSAHSVARLRGPDSLKGRDRLREALAGQGFELL